MKLIAHIDLNAFFVQVEELKDPSLKTKFVAVGGNSSRSVVCSANYLARKRGVHSGMSIKKAKELCPGIVILDGHYGLYSEYSHRFFDYLRKIFNRIMQTSIDECYIDITEFTDKEHARDFLRDLQIDLFKDTDLKCSIGCGPNKFLAKMGSDYQKPMGLTMIFKEDVERILWPIPIGDMYGIGKKTAPTLISLGVKTIGDLANTLDTKVMKILGSMFLYHKQHAMGEGNDELNYEHFDPKSVSAARTFLEDTSDEEELSNMIIKLSKQVSKELIKYKKTSKCVVVTFRTADFVTNSKRKQFDTYENDAAKIASRALQIFETYYKYEPLRLIGVGVSDVINTFDATEQMNIYMIKKEEKSAVKEEQRKETSDGGYENRFHILDDEDI